MSTTPADQPCQCRACGIYILESYEELCPDCESEMHDYYAEREANEREDWIRDMEMTEDNYIRENLETPYGEWVDG